MVSPSRSLSCRAEDLSWADGSDYDSGTGDFVPPVKEGTNARLQLTMLAAGLSPASGSTPRLVLRNPGTAEYDAEGTAPAMGDEKDAAWGCPAYTRFLLDAGLPITVTVYRGTALRAGLREGVRIAARGVLEATAYLYWRARPGRLISARIRRVSETLDGATYLDLEEVDLWRGRWREWRSRRTARAPR